ncbi:tRNA (adenosine(37)-N6)-threonylcarbamoyltransferase complex ATPase subunit type 1 TsaE [Candidatus Purcelliella pentastirinorum]|uniref:tRNA (adenosine(37)-N6)-threonylcarbamoyltransferase complex ATPase subunit type 1 TsaE n=1 Tax=Candidatus Purcelliella pentastirinorum TaxID=472834 RepID=UPI00237A6462|nr:tRNA (adenosine(37)-N6)-threonylcarbamoyltransferase complex ATPase subunit type 1 TsaE [Candidatus Purcelliella pentastirinorum]WDR80458.1 tRNA (adenosine(37)-N6)-threonylcarbamoyltransferase complex ATPase subunit type 1 TsaE [Candidatus Purcelliella pentastirinorum]
MCTYKIKLINELQTSSLGEKLSNTCFKKKVLIYLNGEIGTGKTTLIRAFIKQMGYNKFIKSPTYTIIEKYNIKNIILLHIDLYRINNIHELEILGLKEYIEESSICLIEWPKNNIKYIKKPDININLSYIDNHREAKIKYKSIRGKKIINKLINNNNFINIKYIY